MSKTKTARPRKLTVDGHEIVVEAVTSLGMVTDNDGRWHATSSYSVRVDGVDRGFVSYGYGRNRGNAGWRGYVFGVSFTGDGSTPRLCARQAVHGASRDDLAKRFAGLVQESRAPTREEAETAVGRKASEIAEERERRTRRYETEERESRERKERELSNLDETTEGLRSIRQRLSSELTNLEASALEGAIERLLAGRNGTGR
jgi:hypothetical protein